MSDWSFKRDEVKAFRFVRCGFDAQSGVGRLTYAFDDGPEMTETVSVPGAPFALDDARAQAVEAALRLLHLIAGVSYYKAAVPAEIHVDSYAIDAETAELLQTVYENGPGEFAYRNGLNLRGKIEFPALLPSPVGRGAGGEGTAAEEAASADAPSPHPLSRRERGTFTGSLNLSRRFRPLR